MHDLVIIGGGFWGTALALMAERLGKTACLIDSGSQYGGSRNAAGIFAPKWYHGDWAPRIAQAQRDAEAHGVQLAPARTLHNTLADRKLHGVWHARQESSPYYLFQPQQFLGLRQPDIKGKAVRIESNRVELLVNNRHGIDGMAYGDKIAVCGGAWIDELLGNSGIRPIGVKPLAGSALYYKDPDEILAPDLWLHDVTPYQSLTIRRWSGALARVGDSTERIAKEHAKYLEVMASRVSHFTERWEFDHETHGYRPILPGGPAVTHINDAISVATGGGRIGGLLSFWAARAMLEHWKWL